ncbi:hypothetical protein Tsumi_09870 [Porphyromonas miyakawae]|uniref:YD repeat-containing protein n=1 Tax=Porphyromonas miyakawae TaxID=3137470 RepID=A0ABQ0E2G6_9PORP
MTSKQTENLKTEGKSITYSYDPQRRRLQNLVVNAKVGTIMDNAYSYDAVCNVLSVISKAAFPVKDISTVIDGIRQTISKTAGSKTQKVILNNSQ